jgi:hypothetical protein
MRPHRAARFRRFNSRSMADRMKSSRTSPSSRAESICSTVSVLSGRVSLSGHSFFRPTVHLFRTYDIDSLAYRMYGINISNRRWT